MVKMKEKEISFQSKLTDQEALELLKNKEDTSLKKSESRKMKNIDWDNIIDIN